jgi:hypothetical protein
MSVISLRAAEDYAKNLDGRLSPGILRNADGKVEINVLRLRSRFTAVDLTHRRAVGVVPDHKIMLIANLSGTMHAGGDLRQGKKNEVF